MVDARAMASRCTSCTPCACLLEQAGAASLHIEDQYFPKRVRYHRGIEEIVPAAEMVAKIRATLQARTDPDLLIVARTDAMRRRLR